MIGVAGPGRHDALRLGLSEAGEGWALEFGVHWGQTLKIIARCRDGMVAGFDSFQGLPEDWLPGWEKGMFATKVPVVPGAEIVVGMFTDTVAPWLSEHQGRIALAHLDADLYSSTRDVLTALEPRLDPESILVFDEFHGFPDYERHEFKAWVEFADRWPHGHRYLYAPDGAEQVVVLLNDG